MQINASHDVYDQFLKRLSKEYGRDRADELVRFWRDHKVDPPSSASEVEDFFFEEVSR